MPRPEYLRLGWGLEGELSGDRVQAFETLLRTRYLLLDLDGDGAIQPERDGLALAGHPFVVRLPRVLLLPRGQFEVLGVQDGKLRLKPQQLGLSAELVRDSAFLSELRVRAGVSPVAIDPSASRDCRAHLDYLHQNGVTSGMGMHDEDPGRPGYTPGGAKAGKYACLFPSSPSLRFALENWYATPWHGSPLVAPALSRIGVAQAHGNSMLYVVDRGSVGEPFLMPARGACHVPLGFSERGEIPNPVPGSNYGVGCGFPIYAVLPYDLQRQPVQSFTVKQGGKEIRGHVSSPVAPATPEWRTNSSLALFIPAKPLRSDTRYDVELTIGGRELEWSFSTGAPKSGVGQVASSAAGEALPERLKTTSAVRRLLKKKVPPLSASERPLISVLESLAEAHRVPIHVHADASEQVAATEPLSVELAADRLSEQLEELLEPLGLDAKPRQGAVWVVPR